MRKRRAGRRAAAAPTPEPADEQTSELTALEGEEGAAPTEDPAEPAGEERPATAEAATSLPTEEPDNATARAEETLAVAAEDGRDPRASIGDVTART